MPRRYAPLAIALLTVVLLASGCARPAAPLARTPSPAPTAPPPPLSIKPARQLVWTAHRLPPGIRDTLYHWYNWQGLALTQADGETAYLCNYVDGQAEIWATHDRAEQWAMSGSIAGQADGCGIFADQQDPRQAIVLLFKSTPGTCCDQGDYTYYRTSDGGGAWTPITLPSDDTPRINEVATQGGVTYALAQTLSHSRCLGCYNALFMSRDGMRTWRRIDVGVFAQKGGRTERDIESFWLGSSGELLAEVSNHMSAPFYELWRSGDQGAHWSQMRMGRSGMVDPGGIDPPGIIVADGQTQGFWRACAAYQKSGDYTHPPVQQIYCTLDGGATWLDTGGDNSYHVDAIAQASDGALLAVTPNPFRGEVASTVLRVTPGQSAWESLGALPVRDAPQAVAGTLWLLKRPANASDALTTVYTATYP